jgi:hypothetical protein
MRLVRALAHLTRAHARRTMNSPSVVTREGCDIYGAYSKSLDITRTTCMPPNNGMQRQPLRAAADAGS